MKLTAITAAFGLFLAGVSALEKPLDIEVVSSTPCPEDQQTKKGDHIEMHYSGRLEGSDSEFDSSYNRGTPLSFALGTGRVIKGWDQGLNGMCIGDKRKLTIQPEYGYGAGGAGPIPPNSVLVFDTELVSINGRRADAGNDEL